jgi:hypothetical protein
MVGIKWGGSSDFLSSLSQLRFTVPFEYQRNGLFPCTRSALVSSFPEFNCIATPGPFLGEVQECSLYDEPCGGSDRPRVIRGVDIRLPECRQARASEQVGEAARRGEAQLRAVGCW